jgi:hypothetical protein
MVEGEEGGERGEIEVEYGNVEHDEIPHVV